MNKTLLILLTSIFSYSLSYACSCTVLPFEEAIERADEIFEGRLIRMREVRQEDTESEDPLEQDIGIWSALFEVENKWKGSASGYVEVFQTGTSCDYFFQYIGAIYLVYASDFRLEGSEMTKPFEGLGTYLCSRTVPSYTGAHFEEDISNLNSQFPNKVSLIPVNYKHKVFWLGLCVLAIGLFVGWIMRGRLNS